MVTATAIVFAILFGVVLGMIIVEWGNPTW